MKKYAKQFLIVLLVAAVLLTLSAVLRVGGAAGGLARTLKNDWQLDLPQGYEVEYRSATDDKMKEGGLRYHALLYVEFEQRSADRCRHLCRRRSAGSSGCTERPRRRAPRPERKRVL